MKSAVCLLLPLSFDQFLAISRRNDTSRWGLPGGKVDPGDSNVEALLREVREEIGLQLQAVDVEPIFADVCPGKSLADTYWVTTYVFKGDAQMAALTPEAGMQLQWKQDTALSDAKVSPFAAYNEGAFRAFHAFVHGTRG
jgi:8-oxo-dGTP pyrophosphatase MutT (NUDIX family)